MAVRLFILVQERVFADALAIRLDAEPRRKRRGGAVYDSLSHKAGPRLGNPKI